MPNTTSSVRSTPRTGVPRASAPRPNLWPRRIITGTGLLLILALIVWGMVSFIGWITGAGEAAQSGQSDAQSGTTTAQSATEAKMKGLQPGQEATRDGIVNADETTTIPMCAGADLDISATTETTTVGAGQTVGLTVENRGDIACMSALGELSIQVMTGDELIYDSAKCEDHDQSATPLLLSPKTSWTGSIVWDGKKHPGGCGGADEGGGASLAGTYRVQVFRLGKPTTNEAVFIVEAPPQSGQSH